MQPEDYTDPAQPQSNAEPAASGAGSGSAPAAAQALSVSDNGSSGFKLPQANHSSAAVFEADDFDFAPPSDHASDRDTALGKLVASIDAAPVMPFFSTRITLGALLADIDELRKLAAELRLKEGSATSQCDGGIE